VSFDVFFGGGWKKKVVGRSLIFIFFGRSSLFSAPPTGGKGNVSGRRALEKRFQDGAACF
jgi:hypothetical protein